MLNVLETVIKKPGFALYDPIQYGITFKNLTEAEKKHLGHHEVTENGETKIKVPDNVTRIEYNERVQAVRRKIVGKSSDPALGNEGLAKRQRVLADTAAQGRGGGFLDGKDFVSYMLGGEDETAGGSKATGTALSPRAASSSAGTSSGSGGNSAVAARVAVNPKRRQSTAPDERVQTPPSASKPSGKAQSKKEGRGRPKKDWEAEANKLEKQFVEASPLDKVFWGSESKTQSRIIAGYVKDVNARIKALCLFGDWSASARGYPKGQMGFVVRVSLGSALFASVVQDAKHFSSNSIV